VPDDADFCRKNAPLEALNWVLPQLLAAISAEAGALFMPGRRAGMLVCSACIGPVDIAGAEVPVTSSLVGKVFSDGKRRLSHNLQAGATHDRRIDRQTGLQTRSALTVPVALGPDRFGALQAINKKPAEKKPAGKNISGKKTTGKNISGEKLSGPGQNRADGTGAGFSPADADWLEALAGVLGLAIANMKLARQAVQDRLLERDLEQAGQVQKMMLPAAVPGGRLAGLMLPAPALGGQLAGDFFSWHETRAGHAFCLGDISGKGMGAALLMARLLGLFDWLAGRLLAPQRLALQLNEAMCKAENQSRFASFVCGQIDPAGQELQLVNCGHLPLLLLDPSGARRDIAASCPPLGVVSGAGFTPQMETLTLGRASLFAFSDGITEARFEAGQGAELRVDQLALWLAEGVGLSAASQAERIHRRLEAADLATHDDASLLIVSGAAE